jgi:hypothetical protein
MNPQSAEEVWEGLVQNARATSERDLVEADFKRLAKCATKGQIQNHLWSLWFFFRRKLLLDAGFLRYQQWCADHVVPTNKENFSCWLLSINGTKNLPNFWRKQTRTNKSKLIQTLWKWISLFLLPDSPFKLQPGSLPGTESQKGIFLRKAMTLKAVVEALESDLVWIKNQNQKLLEEEISSLFEREGRFYFLMGPISFMNRNYLDGSNLFQLETPTEQKVGVSVVHRFKATTVLPADMELFLDYGHDHPDDCICQGCKDQFFQEWFLQCRKRRKIQQT